jgi:PAS domain S-box-containing protein
MLTKRDIFLADNMKLPEMSRDILVEQLRWLITLRWFAVSGIVLVGVICSSDLFPVLQSAVPIYVCAAVLFACNILNLLLLKRKFFKRSGLDAIFAVIQLEVDLLLLTTLIHFSGGVTNPFVLFYVFHIIIAAIILSRNLSFVVGISAVCMYGFMVFSEMNDFSWFSHHPLALSTMSSLVKNPVYALGVFVAFSSMVVLTQYLTRTIIVRLTAKELEANRNRDVLEAVVGTMSEGLIFLDNDGKVSICNPAAEKWAEGIRHSIDNFPEKLKEHVQELLAAKTLAGKHANNVNFNLDGGSGRYIEAKTYPVAGLDDDKLGFVIIGQDLSEHKKLEEDLRTRTEETSEINEMLKMSRVQMAHREKMVAIGQMATGIAHEIGNPLTSLSSVVQYLARKITDPEHVEQLDTINHQIERISTILKRMLGLSRPATSEYRWTDVNDVVDRTLALVKYDKRARNLDIKNEPNHDLPMVWLNPLHFEQVVLNIVINALDAMAANDREENVLTITRHFEGDKITIRVADTGVGMDPEICRRAFESFFTTKELGKGTGLGLFISYNIISEIDGSIQLESEVGKGTTVSITIPQRPKKDLISCEGDQGATEG